MRHEKLKRYYALFGGHSRIMKKLNSISTYIFGYMVIDWHTYLIFLDPSRLILK